ncbi:655_t:CDS:2 [Acaulospora morrowiae]|uniref:655_t:CDS:1 n=1 Tax=Acaulospora morrowiae TaxID=94023 RepID=A0A9N8YW28_9GLOM|nr:655_t:CDS:2 [Acaulospora morrowiae]
MSLAKTRLRNVKNKDITDEITTQNDIRKSNMGSKPDLIDRLRKISTGSDLSLRESCERMDTGNSDDLQTMLQECENSTSEPSCESDNDENVKISSNSTRNSAKRLKTKGDTNELKVLLKEIKYLGNDIKNMEEKVETTNIKTTIRDTWLDRKFEKLCDQHEYDTLWSIGQELDLALNTTSGTEALQYVENARTMSKERMVVLNVASKYGWDIAAELPQSKNKIIFEYSEAIEKAKQAASLKKSSKQKYLEEKQFFRNGNNEKQQKCY